MIRLFLFLKKLVTAKFLWNQIKTQIDSGEIITHAAGPAVPSPPSVSSATSVIAETPVSQEIALSMPGVPTVSVSTEVT